MERCSPRSPVLIGSIFVGLAGCEPSMNVMIRTSDYVPAAFRAEWEGPAGQATVWVANADEAEPEWWALTEGEVGAGPASLPITLLPVGRDYSVRVELVGDDGEPQSSEATTLHVPAAPDELGFPHLAFVDPERSELAAGGYTLVNRYAGARAASEAIAFILDRAGEVVWWMEPQPTGHRAVRARLGRDLRSVLILEGETGEGETYINRVSIDGEASLDTLTPDANHDFHENRDGTLTWIAYERAASGVIPDVPYPVVADVVVTGVEGSSDASQHVKGFSFLDDFPSEPEIRCDHQEPDDFISGAVEWTHANSIVRSPANDGFLLMTRSLDALLLIDDGGHRVWQIGGSDATLMPSSPEALFLHAHMSDAWLDDAGALRLLIFDNGNHRAEPITSRVIELRVDLAGGTYDLVWELPDPEGRFSSFLSDARRLPGGNTLVAWTPHGELVEYSPEREEVWRLESEERLGRGIWVPGLGR